ncbi:hypothetical protein FA15DRAFT_80606 [Coprinopsis marcescibilis]|uniref:Uncharacterized protein n=1 Tax=Coprinopsis marcescibilis TaxID=230819 RepID=A0A5C3KMM7_COPMA|nr:hypothetical protein FA15DRAFT_80606 [Coprinopsis marcescibilis]
MFDPENEDAKALLNSRSLSIDKLIPSSTNPPISSTSSPTLETFPSSSSSSSSTAIPPSSSSSSTSTTGRVHHKRLRPFDSISIEIWREVAMFLPRRDLKALLWVPHVMSRVASRLLFREVDLHFGSGGFGGASRERDGAFGVGFPAHAAGSSAGVGVYGGGVGTGGPRSVYGGGAGRGDASDEEDESVTVVSGYREIRPRSDSNRDGSRERGREREHAASGSGSGLASPYHQPRVAAYGQPGPGRPSSSSASSVHSHSQPTTPYSHPSSAVSSSNTAQSQSQSSYFESDPSGSGYEVNAVEDEQEKANRHAQRTADILTKMIVDDKFSSGVRVLRIYCSSGAGVGGAWDGAPGWESAEDGALAFQTGMLTNVLPKLVNLKNVYLSAPSESVVRVLKILGGCSSSSSGTSTYGPSNASGNGGLKLHGLSLCSPDPPPDLSFLELRHLHHFSYTSGTLGSGNAAGNMNNLVSALTPVFQLNRNSLQSLSLSLSSPPSASGYGYGSSPGLQGLPPPATAWVLPIQHLSIRNLTNLNFTGHFGKEQGGGIVGEILREGRQLETLVVVCCGLESTGLGREFRNASLGWVGGASAAGSLTGGGSSGGGGFGVGGPFGGFGGAAVGTGLNENGTPMSLPFLKNFSFTVVSVGRRTQDRDLFPGITEFLRGRRGLKSLRLVAGTLSHGYATAGGSGSVASTPPLGHMRTPSTPGGTSHHQQQLSHHALSEVQHLQSVTGFEAAVWGVLPSLEGLRALAITYPVDMSAGLASWLIPRGVRALSVSIEGLGLGLSGGAVREVGSWLNSLKQGMPPDLRFVGLSDLNLRHVGIADVVERGFPMVRVVKIGLNYWTVHHTPRKVGSFGYGPSSSSVHGRPGSSTGNSQRGGATPSGSGYTPGSSASLTSTQSTNGGEKGRGGPAHPPSAANNGASSSASSHDRLMSLMRPLTHTGHPHSGHTHGHPGSSNPHPMHASAVSGMSMGMGMGRGIMSAGILHSNPGSGGGASAAVGGVAGHHHPHQQGARSAAMSGGGASGGAAHGHGGAMVPMMELEMWPRRRVAYHAAEWLEWLGCEDALVKDTSGYPAWTMCM